MLSRVLVENVINSFGKKVAPEITKQLLGAQNVRMTSLGRKSITSAVRLVGIAWDIA